MNNVMTEYLMVIKGSQTPQKLPPELQGKRIKKCSILEEANFSYSNSTKILNTQATGTDENGCRFSQ